MRIALIEDEPMTAMDLQSDILALRPDWQVVVILGSVRQATEWLGAHGGLDLIFSDIQLGDGTCFDLFARVNPPAPVIFCTAYDQFALQAFQTNGIGYLLKPYGRDALRAVIEKFERLRPGLPDLGALLELLGSGPSSVSGSVRASGQSSVSLSAGGNSSVSGSVRASGQSSVSGSGRASGNGSTAPRRILVHHKDKIIPVAFAEVALFYLHHEQTMLLRFDGQRYALAEKLGDIEVLVGGDFYRASRQHLVNRAAVVEARQYFGRRLLLVLKVAFEEEVTVSKEKVGGFLEWLG